MSPLAAVRELARELEAAGVPSPRVDAEYLVAEVLATSRTALYSADGPLDAAQLIRLRSLAERRRAREPLAYVLGEWGFRHLMLAVDGRALVPRPETEVVVERCLALLGGLAEPEVLDVGVGCGAIALALADEHPGARVTAVDRSRGALALARENAERTGADGRVRLLHTHLLAGLTGRYDLVVSNPPYVSPLEYKTLQPEIRLYEPYHAVVGTGVGEAVAEGALRALRPGGWLVLECGDGQASDLSASLRALGYADVTTSADLAGRERVVEARGP